MAGTKPLPPHMRRPTTNVRSAPWPWALILIASACEPERKTEPDTEIEVTAV